MKWLPTQGLFIPMTTDNDNDWTMLVLGFADAGVRELRPCRLSLFLCAVSLFILNLTYNMSAVQTFGRKVFLFSFFIL